MTKVIGLISGTSVDGIDAALVDVTGGQTNLTVELLAAATYPYPENLPSLILDVCSGASLSMAELAELNDTIAQEFATAALTINQKYAKKAELIGSHGQTVYHRPPSQQLGYSLQLGRGEVIANLTGIPTISNFRAADLAAGGQGAPLVPCVDLHLLSHPEYTRCIQNLGGIGNVTYLKSQKQEEFKIQNSKFKIQEELVTTLTPLKIQKSKVKSQKQEELVTTLAPSQEVLGWDTGPSNTLLDLAVKHFSQGSKTYDKNGEWAASGRPCQELVETWLKQDFFQQKPPKSTGRELFGKDYLFNCLNDAEKYNLSSADILATLTELTAASINHSYRNFLPSLPDQILLCGGGSHNLYLKERIEKLLAPIPVITTAEVGVDVDFKEAIAMAVLAYWRSLEIKSNLPEVTGAKAKVMLGEIHQPITRNRE
ncbi:MAG: anhydro-N-acetylmuramic acid kinase [Okeania sp. SIO3I5]|uniref:anhydro-N-acetylmuramic acid kinase n=1 Tax=Okeania sp. SIO3I5 TaxID=2607805 RepID=UPI0013B5E649|nr:anhydro-N-acetylmuramic acid kinase [Okeania sp. SIO3I5]NEQ36305.1 anhydro-N-acetylmuramic acid kinase [Okeania sp. SIO3I5]